ncbi:hypothetical protein, partial [Herbaspirillum frisingense]|uniref:hypothetical protein n=1 Tax=Herbaspirillum frisingense TaxID=92645 RepID=UPI001ADF4ABE
VEKGSLRASFFAFRLAFPAAHGFSSLPAQRPCSLGVAHPSARMSLVTSYFSLIQIAENQKNRISVIA